MNHAAAEPLVLATHEDTNANAALLRGQEIVAAVAEERLTREKFQTGFPARAVAEVLRLAGVTAADLDAVVAGNRLHFVPRLLGSAPIEGEHDLFGPLHRSWVAVQAHLSRDGLLARAAERLSAALLARRWQRPVALVDHHTAHAWSAWLTSGFPEALAVSVDNLGDGCAARTFRCGGGRGGGGGRCELLWSSDAAASPGQFYGEISQFLGFHVLMAGKVTGLAAAGDPRRLYPVMERLIRLERDDTDFRLAPNRLRRREGGLYRDLLGQPREHVAAAAQQRLEDVLVAYVRRGLRETGLRHVVLAGGVFANVLVNHRIWSLPEVDGVFVHPAMSDQGIATGAALAWLAARQPVSPRPIPHVYLGPAYDEEACGAALERAGLRATREPDIDAKVADLVVEGRVVARFTGRMEYGPRALGHRSILYRTEDPTVNDWLNQRLQRSEFMPFAPATLVEHARACYEDYGEGIAHTARFMTITVRCTEAMRRKSPAVVHLDGTARPQVVHEEFSPGFHRILRRVYERTGVPSVVNTSFNLHGEPIVCTPDDALRSFQQGRLDALALGPFLVRAAGR
jgi:carbamoyltransferase